MDAARAFGEPTVEGTRVPVAAVVDLWGAEGRDLGRTASALGLTDVQIRRALAFDERLHPKAHEDFVSEATRRQSD